MTEPRSAAPRPRSVLVADDHLYREIAQSPEHVALLEDPEAMVVPYSARPEGNEIEVMAIRDLLVASDQLVSGALLVKDPYENDRYAFADDAVESFASAKYHHLANVARLLGAKEVRFIEARIERDAAASEGGARIKIPGFGAEADRSNEITKKLEDRLQGEMRFAGSEPAVEEAIEYVRRRYLANDHQIQALIDMRTGANPLHSYKMSLSATRESDANLRSAAKIASRIPAKAIDIGAGFARNINSFRNIEITTEISF